MSATTPPPRRAVRPGGDRSPGPPFAHRPGLRAALHGGAGFAFGVVVLHPVAMVIFRWLDGRGSSLDPGRAVGELVSAVVHSFQPEMLPMGALFGLFAAVVAAVDGLQRAGRARQQARLLDLERSHRRTTRFLVHDFKTHLGVISGFSELLLERVGEARDRTALERIHRQAHRMQESVQDLLELDRLAGGPRLERAVTSPADLLTEAAADAAGPEAGDRLRLGPRHHDCPSVAVDRRLMVRVLVNLAANALRHGGAEAEVVLDAEPLDAGGVRFTCRDTGRGVPPELEAALFEEFAHGAARGSTGVGLAFCRAAVAAHGGRIGYRPDGGACFYVDLPSEMEGRDG